MIPTKVECVGGIQETKVFEIIMNTDLQSCARLLRKYLLHHEEDRKLACELVSSE